MATVLLSAAGSAIGGSIGGSVLGLSAATIGQAVGAVAGSVLDQTLLGSGSAAVETGRARALRIQSSTEGAPIPAVFGRMRVAGQVIWATRFHEHVRTTTQGGKATGGQRVREFSYTISFAVGICEGPISRIGRVWADGKLLDLANTNHRVYLGDESQLPDPKIEAVEGFGNVPAYRGLAYIVFEDLPIGQFGNRIPQLGIEVFRSPSATLTGAEAGSPLPELIRAVSLSPGTGEFALDPQIARVTSPAGGGQFANVNNAAGVADLAASLDQLEAELPACEQISLVVSWFGTDLRCGHCTVEPRIEERNRTTQPEPWQVAGLTSATATLVSSDQDGRPNFGGTPSDGSLIRAIQHMSSRGKKVVLYPFLLMDIPEGNGLPDPYGEAEQPHFPWRGRITLDVAPGLTGSADQTAVAGADVATFFGSAAASDFTVTPGQVVYNGPVEWTWRRFVLHIAALAAAAGGVEAFCIGTELRGLTGIRSAKTDFPAVQHLIALAAEVRALLPNAKITYAADWSEYFGYQPNDGTGDVLFHLDPLWADVNIDAVGIDDYTPLADWRHSTGHLDAEAGSIYSLPYLQSQVEGGEYYDYYYTSDEDRAVQNRTAISDGAHGEDWIFRPKDLRNWWSNAHHNRVDGVRDPAPTEWVPMSKPIWLTETGCPAVDLGANRPNVFFDGKSSESSLPYGSRGARDDEMQRRFLQAKIGYWKDPSNNPLSPVYAERMIPGDGIFVWTWDARPWPDFPARASVWSDGPAHRLGHWVTGRVTSGALAEVVVEICLRSGMRQEDLDVSRLFGVVDGFLVDSTQTAREALQPLMQAFGFDAYESGGVLVFRTRETTEIRNYDVDAMVPPSEGAAPIERSTAAYSAASDAVRLSYVQSENDYRVGAAEARLPGGSLLRVSETSFQLALPGSRAQQVVERWLTEAFLAQDSATFILPPSALAFEPGDVVQIDFAGVYAQYRIDRIVDAGAREVECIRVEPTLYTPHVASERSIEPEVLTPPGPIAALILDLPLADGSENDHQPWVAVAADPWPGEIAIYKSDDGSGFDLATQLRKPALIGTSTSVLPAGSPGRWQRVAWDVVLPSGALDSGSELSVLNGANRIAVERASGEWELLQFRGATLVGEDSYRLNFLLRGQRGTDTLINEDLPAGARIVVLDDAVVPLPTVPEELGVERVWRAGPAQFDIAHSSFVELVHAPTGAGLRPFPPAHLNADATAGDLRISWIRTTRIGGGNLGVVEVPLAEAREVYQVVIEADSTVVRVAEVEVPEFNYTTAMQVEDGSPAAVRISVAQLSNAYGFGTKRVIETNV